MECEEWTLEDDLKIVNGIELYGYGDWTTIASQFPNRTAKQCEHRYLDKFIINPDNEDLKTIATDFEKLRKQFIFCKYCKRSNNNNNGSVIQILDVENSIKELDNCLTKDEDLNYGKSSNAKRGRNLISNLITCSSYNSYRSEFSVEYDDKAETVFHLLLEPPRSLPFIQSDDHELMEQLKCAIVNSYNFRLAERFERKKIIRNHGLIDMRKTYSMIQRFKVPFGSSCLSTLLSFMKLLKGPELDYLVEKLLYENELRNKINSLLTYRSIGIRFLHGIHIYEKLNKKRLRYKEEIGFNGSPLVIETPDVRNTRRPSAPLALYNLPGFHLLDEDEKHLCSTSRIVPETYYTFKNLLISECKKHNGLKLAQARQLLKIDVNKTRKMYDYLVSTGDIWTSDKS